MSQCGPPLPQTPCSATPPYAHTLVAGIFMGGMALGHGWPVRISWPLGKSVAGMPFAEGVIGLAGLTFHPLFTTLLAVLDLNWIPAP